MTAPPDLDHDIEQLGSFYLGRLVDTDGEVSDAPLLYDANDLTTHAVCLGMTGSGKTGLCIGLLEEAALDGVSAIVIDPKGDLANLMLTFPSLDAQEFRPWIDEGEAARAGRTADAHAEHVAKQWREGLAEWGQGPERIARMRERVELRLYTPGSRAGRPLSVLRSLAAPPAAMADDADALQERIRAAVSGLLALLGVDTDPLRSREHILIAKVLEGAWAAGRNLGLADLIREIQSPPFDAVGVFDLESFFPADDRLGLAMTLNNLLASPGFAVWREGDPLDVGALLHGPDGRPRVSILSIAHLSDPERMFFVTMLLNEIVAWMRTQPGTRSLRAILYMDEVAGYLPPVAAPPSKGPMLTLLKQARAYGLGVTLATQNPVDLDYKALSNIGTWMLGRLQTERDKARLMDGLASADAGSQLQPEELGELLSGLGSRTFLLHNVHEDGPVLFRTRWALSYLRGPLTREQIQRLHKESGGAEAAGAKAGSAPTAAAHAKTAAPRTPRPSSPPPAASPASSSPSSAEAEPPPSRPLLPAEADERFMPVERTGPPGAALRYRPVLHGEVTLHYANARLDIDRWETAAFQAPLEDTLRGTPWGEAVAVDPSGLSERREPRVGVPFAPIPGSLQRPKAWPRFGKMLGSHAYKERPLLLWKSASPKGTSRPGETRGDFLARLQQVQREDRDLAVEKLRKKWEARLARMQEKLRTHEARVDREEAQYASAKTQTAISLGSTVLGALFGRKLGSAVGRATTAARGASRAATQREDVVRAEAKVEETRSELAELEARFREELAGIRDARLDETRLTELLVRPRKSDTTVDQLCLVWEPWWVGAGPPLPAFDSMA
jgi:hypothetical protein